jgi:hypothetical protein
MRKVFNNKLLMFWAVLDVLDRFKQLWDTIAGFKAAHDEFRASTDVLQQTSVVADSKTKQVSGKRKTTIREYVVHLFRATSLLSVLSTNNGDAELKSQVDYTQDELESMRPPELLALSKLIKQLLQTHKTALLLLGLTEADITQVDTIVTSLEGVASSTRGSITKRKTAGAQLRPQFATSSFVLKEKLDKLMEQFRLTQPTFYEEYWNARGIVDYGIRHEEEETPPAPKAE